jgi:NitT/TauT family transport system ATP-binding protein
VLLDEPFSALDFQTRLTLSDEIAAIMREEGKTAILVTHDIGEAVSMADRVIVMSPRPGRIRSEHRVAFPSFGNRRPTPFESRKCPEYAELFQVIWDEMTVHGREAAS